MGSGARDATTVMTDDVCGGRKRKSVCFSSSCSRSTVNLTPRPVDITAGAWVPWPASPFCDARGANAAATRVQRLGGGVRQTRETRGRAVHANRCQKDDDRRWDKQATAICFRSRWWWSRRSRRSRRLRRQTRERRHGRERGTDACCGPQETVWSTSILVVTCLKTNDSSRRDFGAYDDDRVFEKR